MAEAMAADSGRPWPQGEAAPLTAAERFAVVLDMSGAAEAMEAGAAVSEFDENAPPASIPIMPAVTTTGSMAAVDLAPDDEKVQKILTEADVYLKYGLQERAAEHLDKALELDPNCVDAHERLQGIHQKLGDNRAATGSLVALSRIYRDRGEMDRSVACAKEALRLTPDDSDALALASPDMQPVTSAGTALEQRAPEQIDTPVPTPPPLPNTGRTKQPQADDESLPGGRHRAVG